MLGAFTDARDPDEDTLRVVAAVKPLVQEKTNKKYSLFEPVKTKTQVVAGTNYFVKVKVGDNDYLFLKIYEPLPHTQQPPEVHEVHENKTDADEF